MNKIEFGDCLERLKELPDDSIDAVVTDPPYGLSFMGKKWDYDVPSQEIWAECLRVLKPGGHLLAFAGTRTQHRMAVRIEDAGFEIRDMIAWVYGSGFPKSLDVSKAIDKAAGVEFDAVPASGVGFMNAEGAGGYNVTKNQLVRKGDSTDAAQQWQGWGTALKPALEPITVARKPLVGTVAENVLGHGTGALNIDGCRVATDDKLSCSTAAPYANERTWNASATPGIEREQSALGRWPANLIHDGSDEVVAGFPHTQSGARNGKRSENKSGIGTFHENERDTGNFFHADKGSAARFFYCAKASKRDRDEGLEGFEVKRTGGMQATADGSMLTGSGNERTTARANTHPTVKPTDLMRYLCRLVTPPGGVVLDPFMGSGSTGKAAVLEGFQFVGIEREAEYCEIAKARIAAASVEKSASPDAVQQERIASATPSNLSLFE